jgi:PAS domain S-box-containing protein
VTLRAEDGWVVLAVADTGVGIAPAEQQRLFERFHRLRGARARSHEGSGIGLALVAELTALHGGTVEVSSAAGQGSTFTVRLPLRELAADPGLPEVAGEDDVAGRAAAYVIEATRWMASESELQLPAPSDARDVERDTRVLVADDNADMRDYLVSLLGTTYAVQTASDGVEALARMREAVPDLVLTDMMMPRLDGAGLLAAIRADPALAHVPVVMLSARAGEEAAVEGLLAGADDYLVKPFSARELLARVRANLELERTRRARDHYLHLLDDFPALVWRTDEEGRCDYVNNTWKRFTGRDLAQELGRGWLEGVHPDDVDDLRAALHRAHTDAAPFEHEYRLRDGAGEWRWLLQVAQPVRDLAGRFTGLIGSCLDVSERREAEQALRAVAAVEEAAAREHQLALALQRSLLPTVIVHPEDLDVAVCYRAGVAGTVVGGDWYDVVELGAGRTALVIGDVMGRGLHAAAVMGQLRAAVRAYSRLDLPPADVLELLDGVVRDLDDDHIVTCLYAVYDPADRSLTFASAGHPPPLLREPSGVVRRLTDTAWPPLGSRLTTLREERVVLPAGALLALYTDGLVERRGHDLDEGIDRLAELLGGVAGPLDELPDRLVEQLRPAGRDDDDIALLLTRVGPEPSAPGGVHLVLEVPASGLAVHETRAVVESSLRSWEVPRTVGEEIVLAVSELVTNAMLHGRPPIELRMRRHGHEVFVEVRDCATLMPRRMRPSEDDEHGRGLQLVSALTDRWGARPIRDGKAVWCVFRLGERAQP